MPLLESLRSAVQPPGAEDPQRGDGVGIDGGGEVLLGKGFLVLSQCRHCKERAAQGSSTARKGPWQ